MAFDQQLVARMAVEERDPFGQQLAAFRLDRGFVRLEENPIGDRLRPDMQDAVIERISVDPAAADGGGRRIGVAPSGSAQALRSAAVMTSAMAGRPFFLRAFICTPPR
jgi:hypothetical protein